MMQKCICLRNLSSDAICPGAGQGFLGISMILELLAELVLKTPANIQSTRTFGERENVVLHRTNDLTKERVFCENLFASPELLIR